MILSSQSSHELDFRLPEVNSSKTWGEKTAFIPNRLHSTTGIARDTCLKSSQIHGFARTMLFGHKYSHGLVHYQ